MRKNFKLIATGLLTVSALFLQLAVPTRRKLQKEAL